MSDDIVRYQRNFGDGRAFGNNPRFLKLPPIVQARIAAWSNGCPVPEGLIKPIEEGGKGAEYMRDRYIRINFWFGYIMDIILQKGNFEALKDFAGMNVRPEGEVMGKHEEKSVPIDLEEFTFGAGAALGYAFPRVIIEFMGDQLKDRIIPAMDLMDEVVTCDGDMFDMLVIFSEKLLDLEENAGAKIGLAKRLLKHIISRGKLKEDNCYTIYRKIFASLEANAPVLWKTLKVLGPEEMDLIGITKMDLE